MKYRINKKAQGHVEMILSFIIFIGFLLFIFIFMNPFTRTKETSYIIDNMQKSIINEISEEVGKLSVIVSGACYNFTDSYGTNYQEVEGPDNKYIIYFHESFNGSGKTPDCDEADYTLGIYSTEKMIMKQKIVSLKSAYDGGYEDLKISLGITNDFLFEVRDLVGIDKDPTLSVSYSKNIPTGIDIEAREIPIRILQDNGIIIEKKLYIRAW